MNTLLNYPLPTRRETHQLAFLVVLIFVLCLMTAIYLAVFFGFPMLTNSSDGSSDDGRPVAQEYV